jgi:hypothetical protein
MEKIKLIIESKPGKDILSVIILILVGVGSFGLGRLSNSSEKNDLIIEKGELPILQASVVDAALSPAHSTSINAPKSVPIGENKPLATKSSVAPKKAYFASNRGSKYYHIGCTGGKTLKEENKIWFSTKEEAESSGYELSSSCRE